MSKNEREVFQRLCMMTQPSILSMMKSFLKSKYTRIETSPTYVIAFGDIPVTLIAHADTVFVNPPENFYYDEEQGVMWSPEGMGADDRAGIYAIIKIINSGLRPHIVITTDEELGCLGASKLIGYHSSFPVSTKFLVQLDRHGSKDSVYYQCDNPEFENFINTFGFSTNYGTLSDISILGPAWGIAGVNLSVGYYNEHSFSEYLCLKELESTIVKVTSILTHVRDNENVPIFIYTNKSILNYEDMSWPPLDDDTPWLEEDMRPTERCSICHGIEFSDNLIPIVFSGEECGYMCNECYSRLYDSIMWCNNCQRGFYNPEFTNQKLNHRTWLCEKCTK